MKTKLLLLIFIIAFAGCKTSKEGCAGTKYQGPKFKASKFDWYKN
ncbi:MAG TPA: hypothetical protein VGD26_11585 [Chitinophagaceae bacterium]